MISLTEIRSEEDLASALRELDHVELYGENPNLDISALSGIVEFNADDQVAVVWAGTQISELQSELREQGLALPLPNLSFPLNGCSTTVGETAAWNMPHALNAQHGSWRDWVLGGRIVMPDGTVAAIGSKAVKNVAGYDVSRLMVGSRGTLAIFSQLILRLFPAKSIQLPEIELKGFTGEGDWYAQRVLRTDFSALTNDVKNHVSDVASCTVWVDYSGQEVNRFEHDWITGLGQMRAVTQTEYTLKAKEIFDPAGKLHPGAFDRP